MGPRLEAGGVYSDEYRVPGYSTPIGSLRIEQEGMLAECLKMV
jgi:hypothetical protein